MLTLNKNQFNKKWDSEALITQGTHVLLAILHTKSQRLQHSRRYQTVPLQRVCQRGRCG